MCMPVYVSNSIFYEKGQSRMKCVENYDASTKDASRKFLDLLIYRRNLLWNTYFLKFLLNFPDFS